MSNLFRSIEEPVLALVDRWIIDYFSRILWKQFEEKGTVVSKWIGGFIQDRHCIQVLETQPGDNLDLLERQSRLLLIQFMCRMSAGSFGTTIVSTDLEDGRTELEDTLEVLEQIIAIGNHSMSANDLLRIRISLKQQVVYSCCREGNFELASKVFFRQWNRWKTQEEIEARKKIAQVLDSKNRFHEHLMSLTYENTIDSCKQILHKIFSSMAPPFLVATAKNIWERMNNEDIVKESDSDYVDIMMVKKEQTSVLFNGQAGVDMSESLVNRGSMLSSTSSVAGLILSDSKEPEMYAPSETMVTMMPAANKGQTNSVSSSVLSPTVSSAAACVPVSDEAQVTASNNIMRQRKELVGPERRPLSVMTEVAKTSPTLKRKVGLHGKIRRSIQSVTPMQKDTLAPVENKVPSSPGADAKRPRITLSVALQPKKGRPFRKTKAVSSSGRDVSPVVCLTKISSQIFQKKVPSTEISNKLENSRARPQATKSGHMHKDRFNIDPDYTPQTKRKTCNSSGVLLPVESLPRTHRKRRATNDLRLSDISPASSESTGRKRNQSSSPAKKQEVYSSRLAPEGTSYMIPSQKNENGYKIKKGAGTKLQWDADEIDELYKAVQQYGRHWAAIACYKLLRRSPVELYNKWKTISNGRQLKLLKDKFGSV